ncbi:3'-5' DNA helicase, partial [Dipsacomyces acuminosporus]
MTDKMTLHNDNADDFGDFDDFNIDDIPDSVFADLMEESLDFGPSGSSTDMTASTLVASSKAQPNSANSNTSSPFGARSQLQTANQANSSTPDPLKQPTGSVSNRFNRMIHAILSHTGDSGAMPNPPQLGSNWIVEMNGSTPPKSRQALWSSARFVFSTPQILQNDLKTGTLDASHARRIALLVIDEAHRATGKYAYGESVSLLHSIYHGHGQGTNQRIQAEPHKAAPFRVMALTATPGSDIETVQQIINRLHISHIFLRTEESIDVAPYIHGRRIEEMVVALPPWLLAARDCLASVINRSINILCNVCQVMQSPGDVRRVSGYQIRLERDRFCQRTHLGAGGMDTGRILGEFTIAISLAHVMQLLSEHGLRPAWAAIKAWNNEVARAKRKLGSSTRAKIDCVDSKEWATLTQQLGALIGALDNRPGNTANGMPASSGTNNMSGTRQLVAMP